MEKTTSIFELAMRASVFYAKNHDKFIRTKGCIATLYKVIKTQEGVTDYYNETQYSLKREKSEIYVIMDLDGYYIELTNFENGTVSNANNQNLKMQVEISCKVSQGDVIAVTFPYAQNVVETLYWEVASVETRNVGTTIDKIAFTTPYTKWQDLIEENK